MGNPMASVCTPPSQCFCHGARSFSDVVICWHEAGHLASQFDPHSMGIHTLVFGFGSNPVFKEMLQNFKFSRVYFIPLFHLTTSQIIFLFQHISIKFHLSRVPSPKQKVPTDVCYWCVKLYYWQGNLSALETLMTIPLDSFALWLLS